MKFRRKEKVSELESWVRNCLDGEVDEGGEGLFRRWGG